MSQAKWQRARWVLVGIVIGTVLTVLTWVGLAVVFASNDVDAEDATKVANRWATGHQRPSERYDGAGCFMYAGGYRFVCWVRYKPTNRRFTLFLSKTAEGGDYSVVLSHVERGRRPLADFQP